MNRYGIALLLLAASSAALADSRLPAAQWANTALPDARLEKSARALMEEIRCLVCQGQSIADSDAESAADMRALIRQRVAAGEAPASIRAWLIERYGDYVSYAPPLSMGTLMLWILPLLLLGLGLIILRGRFRGGES